jgi:hypothetical protein
MHSTAEKRDAISSSFLVRREGISYEIFFSNVEFFLPLVQTELFLLGDLHGPERVQSMNNLTRLKGRTLVTL